MSTGDPETLFHFEIPERILIPGTASEQCGDAGSSSQGPARRGA
jgi:hypothetical protein